MYLSGLEYDGMEYVLCGVVYIATLVNCEDMIQALEAEVVNQGTVALWNKTIIKKLTTFRNI